MACAVSGMPLALPDAKRLRIANHALTQHQAEPCISGGRSDWNGGNGKVRACLSRYPSVYVSCGSSAGISAFEEFLKCSETNEDTIYLDHALGSRTASRRRCRRQKPRNATSGEASLRVDLSWWRRSKESSVSKKAVQMLDKGMKQGIEASLRLSAKEYSVAF
jgi:hypothetical protein